MPEGALGGERREFSLQEGAEACSSDKAPWVRVRAFGSQKASSQPSRRLCGGALAWV
jgi:hypothetical protein